MIFAVHYVGTIDVNMEKIKLRSYLSPGTKFNSNWSIGLNVKGKMIKLLEDNKGEYLYDIKVFKKAFLNLRHKKYQP